MPRSPSMPQPRPILCPRRCRLWRCQRQREGEDRTLAFLALDPDTPTVAPHDLGRDVEAKAKPRIRLVFLPLNAEEAVEHLALLLFGDTEAEIAHAGDGLPLALRGPHDDPIRPW